MTQFQAAELITPKPVRLSFTNLHTPNSFQLKERGETKYGATLLIPKEDWAEVGAVYANAFTAAVKAGVAAGKFPAGAEQASNFGSPFKDGDTFVSTDGKSYDSHAGYFFIRCTSNRKISILLPKPGGAPNEFVEGQEIDVYPGSWAKAHINFFAYSASGNRGVSVGINAVLKDRDDEAFSGGVDAATAFGGQLVETAGSAFAQSAATPAPPPVPPGAPSGLPPAPPPVPSAPPVPGIPGI